MARANGKTKGSAATASLLSQQAGPVALYARVSSEDQAERQTIQAQVEFLRQYCRLYDLPVAGEYLDEGVSGTIPLAERPRGRQLLADARDGRIGAILVYRIDRLARKLKILLAAYDELETHGVAIRSATEPLDTSTPVGRFVFQLLGSLSELEKSTILERMTLGRDRVARSGQWITGRIPYGYDVDDQRHLIPSERPTPLGTEAGVVRQIVERIAAGSTLVAEARRLTGAGVPAVMRYSNGKERINPRGWQQSRLGAMLNNDGYVTGIFTLESQHGPVQVAAPLLAPPELWLRARAQLATNKKMATRNAKRPYLLRGLIRCSRCGRAFIGMVIHSKGREYRYYRCGGALPAVEAVPERRCRAPYIAADWLETEIWQDIRAFILDPGPALAEAQAQVQHRLALATTSEAEQQRLLKRLADVDRGRDSILELVRRGRISLAEAEHQLEDVAAERAWVQAELDAVRSQVELAAVIEAQVTEASVLLAKLRDQLEAIEAGGTDARRPWIQRLVSRIIVEWEAPAKARQRPRSTVTVQYVFGEPSQMPVDSNQYWQA